MCYFIAVWVSKVLDVQTGQLSVLLGTIYCDLPMKPNVLKDLADDNSLTAPPTIESYYAKDDDNNNNEYDLEDMSGRVRLVFDQQSSSSPMEMNRLVTGVVAAFLGTEQKDGSFLVQDYCSAFDVEKITTTSRDADKPSIWVGFVSGIKMGNESSKDNDNSAALAATKNLSLEMLADFISGEFNEKLASAWIKLSIECIYVVYLLTYLLTLYSLV